MKRTILSLSFLFTVCLFASVSAASIASSLQGISYYKAGFPLVAKPLLLEELNSSPDNKAEVCFYLGNIYFGENKADSAAIYFNKGLSANPMNSLNAIGLSMLKLKSNKTAADLEIVNALKLKQNKSNIDVVIAAGRAYLVNGILDQAIVYQEKAKKMKPKYASVYVLLGDIELAKKNTGAACSNYEMAIYFDDSNKEAYVKYARAYNVVNTPLAIEKLNELKKKDPSFLLADKELGDIYYSTNDFAKSAEMYGNYIKSGNSNVLDLIRYGTTLFFKGDYKKSMEIVQLGVAKDSRNAAFNRLLMYNNVGLKKYDEALVAADVFFNKSNNSELNYYDYTYYATALNSTQQYALAAKQYEKAFSIDSSKISMLQKMSEMYGFNKDSLKAISSYEKYISLLPLKDQNFDVFLALGKLYLGYGKSISGDAKKASILKADSLFKKVATLEPNNYIGNYYRAQANSDLDPETTLGLAKPFYEQTAALLESKADTRFNSTLVTCYSYLGIYYFKSDNNALSKPYWTKVLAIEPNNPLALKVLEGINKPSKPTKTKK